MPDRVLPEELLVTTWCHLHPAVYGESQPAPSVPIPGPVAPNLGHEAPAPHECRQSPSPALESRHSGILPALWGLLGFVLGFSLLVVAAPVTGAQWPDYDWGE